MHAFVRKGLLLSATTGTLVMAYAGTAAADDSATTRGAASDSPGAVSGNVAQVPADVPIQVCGDAGAAGAGLVGSRGNECRTDDTTAKAFGAASDSPGAISGNVGSVAANVPVQACGLAGGALAADVTAHGNECVDDGTHALAKGFASDSPGLVSGNVLQLAADVPVQACGDSIGLLAFGTAANGNQCVNGAPHEGHEGHGGGGPVMSPPPVPCPPPPPSDCPPPAHSWGAQADDASPAAMAQGLTSPLMALVPAAPEV